MTRHHDTPWADGFSRILGDEIRTVRKMRGWRRKDLLAHMGEDGEGGDYSLQTLATYELGTRRISVVRLVEITHALDESLIELIKRAYNRTFDELRVSWTVDLIAASRLADPELAPLRHWARFLRNTAVPEDAPTTARLDLAAVRPLAELCGIDADELKSRLPQPTDAQ